MDCSLVDEFPPLERKVNDQGDR